MNDAALMIVVTDAQREAEKETTLDKQIRAAMKAAKNHWMVLDEDLQFRGAVGALLLITDEETQEKIKGELKNMKYLNAMLNGIPVDVDRMDITKDILGLAKIWREID